jgi:hypothetical protein
VAATTQPSLSDTAATAPNPTILVPPYVGLADVGGDLNTPAPDSREKHLLGGVQLLGIVSQM